MQALLYYAENADAIARHLAGIAGAIATAMTAAVAILTAWRRLR